MSPLFKMLAAASVCAVAVTGCAGVGPDQTADSDNTVRIGLAAAFSGATAYLGQDSKRGIELAIDELNEAGGEYSYELVTADDECTPQGGGTAFGRLIDVEQVDVILGSPCSGSALGGKPLLGQGQVPGMTFGASSSEITADAGEGGAEYQWRMNIDDAIMGEAFARYIADQDVASVAILTVNNDFGRGAADIYKEALPEQGVDVTTTEIYEYQSSDVRAQLTKIRDTGAEGLVFFGEAPNCALIFRNMDELGMKMPTFSRSACSTQEALKAMGDPTLADGNVEVSYWAATDDQPMIEAFEEKYGEHPPYNAAMAYYGMLTLHEAVQAGGPTRSGIQDGLGEVSWESPIGPIEFDDHNQAHHDMFVVKNENGKLVVVDQVPTSGDAS